MTFHSKSNCFIARYTSYMMSSGRDCERIPTNEYGDRDMGHGTTYPNAILRVSLAAIWLRADPDHDSSLHRYLCLNFRLIGPGLLLALELLKKRILKFLIQS